MRNEQKIRDRQALKMRAHECLDGFIDITPRYSQSIREAWLALWGEQVPDEVMVRIRTTVFNRPVLGKDEPLIERLEACLKYHRMLRENSQRVASLIRGEA